MRIVLDTNVVVAGLLSRRGASHWILRRMLEGKVMVAASVPLFVEYEAALKRPEHLARVGWTPRQVDEFLDGMACVLEPTPIRFLWRPGRVDPGDEMVVECVAASGADALVTSNTRHMRDAAVAFGFRLLTPDKAVAASRLEGVEP